jgi:hypothetical protein
MRGQTKGCYKALHSLQSDFVGLDEIVTVIAI